MTIHTYILSDDETVTCEIYGDSVIFLGNGQAEYCLFKECLDRLILVLLREGIIKLDELKMLS